jgi:TIGR03009 family protein
LSLIFRRAVGGISRLLAAPKHHLPPGSADVIAMHTHLGRLVAVFALALSLSWAMPLLAQQNSGQPARAQQGAAPRGTRQALPPVSNNQRPRGRVAQTGAAQPAGQVAIAGVAPQVPFTLTPQQQQLLNQTLLKWENQSARIKTFKCTFGRWEVNFAFGPKENNYWLSTGQGEIKFKAPDHGIYIVRQQQDWDPQKRAYVARTEGLDHWVCNGQSIFEYNAEKKQLIERRLAPELQGKAITDGPLPFIFGAKADQLNRRYWMRDITPADEINQKVWLEAWPKFQQDAANFQHAIIILNARSFIPEALRIILPDGRNKQDYAFSDTQVNDPLSILKGDFLPPIKPFGWEKIVEPAPTGQAAAPVEQPGQAERPRGTQRK